MVTTGSVAMETPQEIKRKKILYKSSASKKTQLSAAACIYFIPNKRGVKFYIIPL
jgi:hypothetical protein